MNRILSKAIVTQYYRINAGFFLVLLLLLFGLLPANAVVAMHQYLMTEITSNWLFLAGASLLWFAYSGKCLLYCHRELRNPTNGYLYHMQALPWWRHYGLWLAVHAQLMMPTLLYGAITVALGIHTHHYGLAILFAAIQIVLLATPPLLSTYTTNNTWRHHPIKMPALLRGVRKRPVTFLLHYALHMRKGTFIGLKALSVLLLQGMVAANTDDINKESVAVLMMFLISAHALLPVYFVQFAAIRLRFVNNLPISRAKLLLTGALTFAVIYLPEFLFLTLNGRHALPAGIMLSLYAVAIAQTMLYAALLYLPRMTVDRYTMVVLGLFFVTLLFLASFNLWLLCIVESVATVAIFYTRYRQYELP